MNAVLCDSGEWDDVPRGVEMAKGMGMPDGWHKRLAIQIVAQLPENQEDAEIVLALVKELASNWLFTSEAAKPPHLAPVLHFPTNARSQDAG